ncbi:MAG: dienelactone hydrolase family protein [Burkholderiales bacterium]|nr:dienelactone hydrolase family protein [Burkholderiales bacterium]
MACAVRALWGKRLARALRRVALLVGVAALSTAWAEPSTAHLARLQAGYAIVKPPGDGPFPAVILVPGCQGFNHRLYRSRYERATGDLESMGFVVARADYLAAIEASSCDLVMDPVQAASDVLATARHLQALPFVKPDAINVIGWSFGGGLALGMLEQLNPAGPQPVAAVVAYSPYLALRRPWTVDVPVLILCTLQDTVAPCERTDALLGEMPDRKQVRHVKLPEGLHAFDAIDVAPGTSPSGQAVGYHETTAKAAWTEVLGFLRR